MHQSEKMMLIEKQLSTMILPSSKKSSLILRNDGIAKADYV